MVREMTNIELKNTQPIVYQILSNAFKGNTVSQGYLFIGEEGTPMLESAILLAQSLICEHSLEDGLGCGVCSSCVRIQEGNFADLIVLDGTEKSIKKEMILKVRETFSKTALETYGKQVYIINGCENATPEALNSLLKFLEEPNSNVYAILITYRIESLLDTIISRVQNIKFRPIGTKECADQTIALGVNEEDAQILSRIVSSPKEIHDMTGREEYIVIKTFLLEFLQEYARSKELATVDLQTFIQRHRNSREIGKSEYVLLLDMWIVYCKECIVSTFTGDNLWNSLVEDGKSQDQQFTMRVLLEAKDELLRSPNVALLLDKVMYRLKKGV
ncbi:MAG: DNA polymerase III subunit [Erysipelotrichales bacterium]|nr:DNA polymerase III subunit [Erysipelotrichales bacterium]